MILLLAAIVPGLLWDEGPQTAPVLEKAGIREIATTGDASAWSGTRIRAVAVDGSAVRHEAISLPPKGAPTRHESAWIGPA